MCILKTIDVAFWPRQIYKWVGEGGEGLCGNQLDGQMRHCRYGEKKQSVGKWWISTFPPTMGHIGHITTQTHTSTHTYTQTVTRKQICHIQYQSVVSPQPAIQVQTVRLAKQPAMQLSRNGIVYYKQLCCMCCVLLCLFFKSSLLQTDVIYGRTCSALKL